MTAMFGQVSNENQLSPEFFDVIYEWDSDAANDDYYTTSAEFTELHSQIKKDLIRRMVQWAICTCGGMLGLVLIYG
jgi:hypothetical protein